MDEKLQKVLARAGYGSRREIEAWIAAGRVSINGERATLGARVSEQDVLRIDGHVVATGREHAPRRRVLMYNKPVGEVCTRADPEGRPTIFANLPRLRNGRWITVGRLDLNTAGLLLLTNDGELANRLMHPSSEIEREYAVRVLGEVDKAMLERLRGGVELEDGPAAFDGIREAGGEGANRWFHVLLREGRKREVRRLWESQGVTVSRLMRVRFGPIALRRGLRPGHWEDLDSQSMAALLATVGMTPQKPPPKRGRSGRGKAPRRPRGRR